MIKFKIGDCVASCICETMIGTVTKIVNDKDVMVSVSSKNGICSMIADTKYWRLINND